MLTDMRAMSGLSAEEISVLDFDELDGEEKGIKGGGRRRGGGEKEYLEVRVRFPALPHFLRSSGSGTGSTQPREYN
jgi:hypothetical protein